MWGVNIAQPDVAPYLLTQKLGSYNSNQTLVAYPDRRRGLVIIERLADGETWELDTQESGVAFSPNGRLLWTEYDRETSWRSRTSQVRMADTDGSNAQLLATLNHGSPVAWLPPDELLVASRVPPSQDTLLSKLSLEDGSLTV